jgi:hypothetical protein
LTVTGPGAINIAYERTLVVTRLLFFYPKGPKAMFGPEIQAHRIRTQDFMFHPKSDLLPPSKGELIWL